MVKDKKETQQHVEKKEHHQQVENKEHKKKREPQQQVEKKEHHKKKEPQVEKKEPQPQVEKKEPQPQVEPKPQVETKQQVEKKLRKKRAKDMSENMDSPYVGKICSMLGSYICRRNIALDLVGFTPDKKLVKIDVAEVDRIERDSEGKNLIFVVKGVKVNAGRLVFANVKVPEFYKPNTPCCEYTVEFVETPYYINGKQLFAGDVLMVDDKKKISYFSGTFNERVETLLALSSYGSKEEMVSEYEKAIASFESMSAVSSSDTVYLTK